eukprot:Awhi_evm1s14048
MLCRSQESAGNDVERRLCLILYAYVILHNMIIEDNLHHGLHDDYVGVLKDLYDMYMYEKMDQFDEPRPGVSFTEGDYVFEARTDARSVSSTSGKGEKITEDMFIFKKLTIRHIFNGETIHTTETGTQIRINSYLKLRSSTSLVESVYS